jgi:hypothetical protein
MRGRCMANHVTRTAAQSQVYVEDEDRKRLSPPTSPSLCLVAVEVVQTSIRLLSIIRRTTTHLRSRATWRHPNSLESFASFKSRECH